MEPLALEPGTFRGTYKLVGGRKSLDFVNTLAWSDTDQPHDWLDRAGNVVAWALAVDLIDRTTARALERRAGSDLAQTGRSLARIRHQRGVMKRVLSPLAHDERPAPTDVEALNDLLSRVHRFRRIDPGRLVWAWATPRRLHEILRPVIADACDVLVDGERARIGHCPTCGWLFYDATRSRSRRWCDMADCGSRDKSRRYYQRRQAAGPRR